jgi:hypothetical protein
MRRIGFATTFVCLTVSTSIAAESLGRALTNGKQAPVKTGWTVPLPQEQPRAIPTLRDASEIPIISLPKPLRPTRPPAGSPL